MKVDDVTLGELSRRLDLMHGDLQSINSRLVDQTDLQSVADARREALVAHEALTAERFRGIDARMTKVENTMTWLTRTVATQVIVLIGSLATMYLAVQ